ncbi:putative metalloprotease [Bradyrhizobium sp. USDA 4350]
MRYDDFRRSDDVEDRRDDSGGGGGGGGFGIPMGGGGGLGIGTVIVLGLLGYAFGIDPRILIGGAEILTGGGQAPSYQTDRQSSGGQAKRGAPTDEMGSMIAGILGEIDDRWSEIFQASGQTYTGPKIVLFRNATNGGRCGMAQSAMGPFYCPPDKTIFLDTGFFREVETRFRGCSGNACKFTAAYIIAHEAGHHIQNLLGIIPAREPVAAAGRQQGRGQRVAGQGRVAGRLPLRRLGQPRGEEAAGLPRGRRHRRRADHGECDRRRHAATAGDGQGGA